MQPNPSHAPANDRLGSFLCESNGWIRFLFWTLIFGLSYTQAPLYYSNQNQYFLHGFAQAEMGSLHKDWLANTLDPTPVFSALVAFTVRYLHEYLFYLCYLLILGVYFHNLLGVFKLVSGSKPSWMQLLCFATLFVALHAGLLRLASAQLFGVDYPWYFQAGVAAQYLLGFGLQPSVCGVFLLVSILAFLRDQPWRAVIWACLAATLHSTYLLGAAFLTLSYMFLEWRHGFGKRALCLGLLALLLVSPVVTYNLISFAPSTPGDFAKAQGILAHFRIPLHAEPQRWFDAIALGQVLWVIAAIVLVRKSPLFFIMLITSSLSLLLTGVQLWTNNDTLALLFPWRTSVSLVPLATTVILARLVGLLAGRLNRETHVIRVVCAATLGVCVTGGIAIWFFELGYRTNRDELPMMQFVKANRGDKDVYLLPVSLPKHDSAPRGAFSTNFTPAPRAGKSGHLIAIDLQRFRLSTEAAIFVDFKAIPYRDAEVLEWHRRLLWAHKMYAERNWNTPSILKELMDSGVSHVVTTTDRDIRCAAFVLAYADENYRVYRVERPAKADRKSR